MNIHDSGYKKLFENRTIFRQLVQTFVEEEWVQELDFERTERIDKSFISQHYKETEADLIYKVPWRNTVVYFYTLLEFQSTVDPFMVLRVLYYILSLYMDLRDEQPTLKKLPVVFPIVLYNGERRWHAPESMSELIAAEPALGEQRIRFSYFKIAENEYTLDRLLAIRNIVSTLFIAETHFTLEQLVEAVTALFDSEEDKLAVSLFANWIEQMAAHGRIEPSAYATLERVYRTSLEVKSMLQHRLHRMLQTEVQREVQIAVEREVQIAVEREVQIAVEREVQIAVEREEEQIRKESEAKGKTERNREIAQAMLAEAYPLAVIAHLLGLGAEEVQTLLAEEASQE